MLGIDNGEFALFERGGKMEEIVVKCIVLRKAQVRLVMEEERYIMGWLKLEPMLNV